MLFLGTARRIRVDYGSENGNVAGIQRYFRDLQDDDLAGEKSYMSGKSTSNQVDDFTCSF